MYELVRQRLPDAAVISIAHRPAVVGFHRRQLIVDPSSRRVASEAAPLDSAVRPSRADTVCAT
jgi:ABC-type uncharacterized transport system fused permease/ATPase subunit